MQNKLSKNLLKQIITASICLLAFGYHSYAQNDTQDYGYTVQDTFFGLKLGKKYSTQDIKDACSPRSSFLGTEKRDGLTVTNFKDTRFAGIEWDYSFFNLSEDGIIYRVGFETVYGTSFSEREEAQQFFDDLRERLEKKYIPEKIFYGKGSKSKDKKIRYRGDNGVGAMLVIYEDKDTNDWPQTFVDLIYLWLETYFEIDKREENEL